LIEEICYWLPAFDTQTDNRQLPHLTPPYMLMSETIWLLKTY